MSKKQYDDLKVLAAHAVFGINTVNDGNLIMSSERALASKTLFGVFVSLFRNENVIAMPHDKLDVDERQIHGCMGHWNPKYQSMSAPDLIANMRQLVKDVRTKDERRLQYPTDVDEDASAVIEISFMKLPLREIDDGALRTRFNNKTQGVLVDTGSGKRATYLPGVFPDASWTYIAQSLRQKAGIGASTAARFYAYDTINVEFQLYDVLFSAFSVSCMRSDVALFYLKHYANFVPYEYNASTREVKVIETEAVRNLACIGDVVAFARDYKAAFENKPILANLEHYYQKWLKNPSAHRQASIFLVRAYNRWGVHQSRVQLMIAQLYTALDGGALEPRFELGEAVTVLAQTSVPRVKSLQRAIAVMRERAEAMLRATTTPLDNVFELNWQSQSVHQMCKLESSSSSSSSLSNRKSRTSELNACAEHAVLLFSVFVKTAQRTILRLESLETNYLAVIYECLSNLDAVIVLLERKQPAEYYKPAIIMAHNEIRNQRMRYFAALRRGEYGLYYFKNGKTARLDITGHVIW